MAEIKKIKHLGPKRHRFGLCYKKKKSPRTSLSSPTSEKMEKNKKRKEKKNMKMLEARCLS